MARRSVITLVAFSLGLFLISVNLYAFNLVGVWKLTALETQTADNAWVPDTHCYRATGLIIYTASGYMSAGVNCMDPKHFTEPDFAPGDITFYMGKYIVKDHHVIHIPQNAAKQDDYQTPQTREFHVVNKNKFVLIIKKKDGALARLTWQRVAVN